MVHVQAGGVDRLAGAVAGDAGVAAAVLLPDIHQDEAVLGARAGDLVSGRVCFNPQQILQRFFLQPVHTGSRGAYGCEKKKQQTLPSTFKNISIEIIQLGRSGVTACPEESYSNYTTANRRREVLFIYSFIKDRHVLTCCTFFFIRL